jgi:alpha-beta hydrolase superfamily lysophospholipase
MLFLASNGYRRVAHDRRGRGRSSQTWSGNDMDTYADDLSELTESLDLQCAVLTRPARASSPPTCWHSLRLEMALLPHRDKSPAAAGITTGGAQACQVFSE